MMVSTQDRHHRRFGLSKGSFIMQACHVLCWLLGFSFLPP